MKRTLSLLFAIMASMTLLYGATVTQEINGINYKLNTKDNTAEVVSGTYSGEIIIPSSVSYDGKSYSVVSIGSSAFAGQNILKITLPNSITKINSYAFRNCTGLNTITLPNGSLYIGSDVFEGCTVLAIVNYNGTMQEWCTIDFYGDDSTPMCYASQLYINGENVNNGNLKITEGITEIKKYAFYNLKRITSVTFPTNSLQAIGNYAFSCCANLSAITIPNSVTSLGAYVFASSGMKTATIGTGVTIIPESAFYHCTQLATISLLGNVTSIAKHAFSSCLVLDNVILPNSIMSIGESAFMNCTQLKSITLPENIEIISKNVFKNCTSLASLTIPNKVIIIDANAFEKCSQLSNIIVGTGLTTINTNAFLSCTALQTITLPNNVESINANAFANCSSLAKVDMGNGIISMKTYIFSGCTKLKDITVRATTPPVIESTTFYGINSSHVIKVPCGSLSSYQSELYWKNLTLEGFGGNCGSGTTTYTVFVSSANTSMGTVSGGGTYEEGATATVTATPKSGYKFTKWSNGSTTNPYSFTVTSNVSLTAYFEQSSTPEPENSKLWNMSDAAFNSLGTISSQTTIDGLTIYATSAKNVVIDASSQTIDGLSFTHRLKLSGTGASDARMLSFKVEGDCDIDVYLMSASSSADRTLNIDKGSFGNSWKTIPALGSSATKGTVHYTGGAATMYLYSPSSGVNIYAIRVTSESTPQPTTYTVSVSSANTSMGTVSGGGTYEEGATATVTAIPKSGYKFTKWSNGSTVNPYSFTVTSNMSLTAYFEQSSTPHPESSTFWNMSDAAFNSLGTITSTKTINGLTIKATSDKAVTIDADAREIDGLSFTHRLKFGGTGASDARLLSFQVNGDCDIDIYLMSASGTADRTLNVDKGSFGNSWKTIPALGGSISKGTVHYTGNATTIYLYSPSSGVNIYAIRVAEESSSSITTYSVSVSSANSSMGTVSGGGQYEEGSTATITATPKSGYKFTKWSNGSTANPYSFTVTQNISLTAHFEQSSTPQQESKFWNISDAAFNSLGTISSNKTINGLTIYATISKNVVIDENSQEIDGMSFTHRLKFGGTGSSDSRLLSFQVDGDCDIDVYLMSASGSADRTLNVDKGSFGNSWKTIPALGASISKGTVHYTGSATTIYMYSPSSGVNIYAIRVSYGNGHEGIETNSIPSQEKANKIIRNGQVFILRGNHTYTLTGQEVK